MNDQQLQRKLKNRHVQLIALGGAIGTGLFYGSATSVSLVGPGLSIAYIIGGIMIFFILRALAEMSVDTPVSGAFSTFAYENVGKFSGFLSGWNYWFTYIVIAMTELSVVGIYVNYWFPQIPTWVTALVIWAIVTALNIVSVKVYGEVEFWLALVKVLAIILMIGFGLIVIFFGVGNGGVPTGISNLWTNGGFLPNGIVGLLFSLVLVMFSFGGTELVCITAGEVDNPEKTIPKAINQVIFRILIFYIGALTVIMCIVPWDEIGQSGSPFVIIFDKIGIPAAATILNIVVLTAAVSAYNSALYSNGRMLYALAEQGNAPAPLSKLGKNGSPFVAVLVSSGATLIVVGITAVAPEQAFGILMSIATAGAIINWFMILVTQLKFRKRIGPDATQALKFKMPFFPYSNYIAMAFLIMVVVIMAVIPDFRFAIMLLPVWIIFLYIMYKIRSKNNKKNQDSEINSKSKQQ